MSDDTLHNPPKAKPIWANFNPVGKPRIFKEPINLWEAAVEYFNYIDDNPLFIPKLAQSGGEPVVVHMEKRKPYILEGLFTHMGISRTTWYTYSERDEYKEVITAINHTMHSQKVEGAATGEFNAMIIARVLGLKDATTAEVSGPDGGPIVTDIEVSFVLPEGK